MSARYTKYDIQNTSAYTLIEVLVTLAIVGILFAVGYANFRDFTRRQSVLDSAKEIQGDLRLAQSMALTGEVPAGDPKCTGSNTFSGYNFSVLTTGPFPLASYEIIAKCTGAGGVATTATKIVSLSSTVTLSKPNPNPITFNGLGNGTNIPGGINALINITQVGTGNKVTVSVSSGGQIQ